MPATRIIHKSFTPGQIYPQLRMQDTPERRKRRGGGVSGSMMASSSTLPIVHRRTHCQSWWHWLMRKRSHHYSIRLIDYMESQWRETLQGKVHAPALYHCGGRKNMSNSRTRAVFEHKTLVGISHLLSYNILLYYYYGDRKQWVLSVLNKSVLLLVTSFIFLY